VAGQAKRVIRLSDGEVVADGRMAGVHDPPPAVRPQKPAHDALAAGIAEAEP